jgi:hypothetical protein
MNLQSVPPHLNERKHSEDIYVRFKRDFEQTINSSTPADPLLTKHNAMLGLLFINEVEELKPKETYRVPYWLHMQEIVYKSERYNRIDELLGEEQWRNPENFNLLLYMFGQHKAACVNFAWITMNLQMYQTGYTRRSFRSPNNKEMYFANQINFIIKLIPQVHLMGYNVKNEAEYAYFDLTMSEQIKYSHELGEYSPGLFRIWSAAIDLGDTEVFEQLKAVVFNTDTVGKVTRSVIKALLNSQNKEESWELVAKLLLAAQRQEGLRQVILECLDETSIRALIYILRVVKENKLTRFSSVVRALDVWTGLNLEAEREAAVNAFVDKALYYLENPAEIEAGIGSENNADVYMALWALGVFDVELTFGSLDELAAGGDVEKRTLAMLFAKQTKHYKIMMPLFYARLTDDALQPLACAVNFIRDELQSNPRHYNTYYTGLFDELHKLYQRVTVKEKTFTNFVFSGTSIVFDRSIILQGMSLLILDNQDRLNIVLSYLDDMDATLKGQMSRIVLPAFQRYHYDNKPAVPAPLTSFQREYALRILKDRNEYEVAKRALKTVSLTADEMSGFPELLKRKAADFRSSIIELLLQQDDAILSPVVEKALLGDVEQRLAGLDILLQLKKSKRPYDAFVTAFKERKSISQKEEILLSQLTGETEQIIVSEENGYGVYNPANCVPPVLPEINPDSVYEKMYAENEYAFSLPFKKITEAVEDLKRLFNTHRNFEYDIEYWDNSKHTIILGNNFRRKSVGNKKEEETDREKFEDYPLYEVWEGWYQKWGLQPRDLLILSLTGTWEYGQAKQTPVSLLPEYSLLQEKEMKHPESKILPIIIALRIIYPFDQVNEFCLGAATRLYSTFDEKILQYKDERYGAASGHGWQSNGRLTVFLKSINVLLLKTVGDVLDCWNLYNWQQYSGRPENVSSSIPPLVVFCMAYINNVIGKDDMYRGMFTTQNIAALTGFKRNKHDFDFIAAFPQVKELVDVVREQILDVELKRGDSATSLTSFAGSLRIIYGVNRLAHVIGGLGKTTLYKGYSYSYGGKETSKQESFSNLLEKCQPLPTDTQEIFNEAMKSIKVSESRLIEVAVYAPQWQKFISSYLDWKGLDSAIWWMHAHTKTSAYQARSAEQESEIAKYSSLDVDEFKEGAVDKEWFLRAYKEIGKERWTILYDAAKYISDGNGHRRARIYADVLLGDMGLKEITEKVTGKRDQDCLRVYGLVPLNKKNPGSDVLSRYEYLQQFKKESKQFGAQKQGSEGIAIRIAMDNLARNAGYADPVRLTWAMEIKQLQHIFSKETTVTYDDVTIRLLVDEEGEAHVVAYKDDKPLKALPAKYKKDAKVEELNGYKKTLREQLSRSRKTLEDTMVRGDEFLYDEMGTLFSHPVISKHLSKLVFVSGDKFGFYKDGVLIGADGVAHTLSEKDKFRIAHCTDFYRAGVWADYQRYAFDNKLEQPFKQIFRELYVPTEDELKEKSISRRYAGHQVQPKQTVALLKTRGWKVNYEEGLQKVFHKEGFSVQMYAMADWFSPAEVESPTLETVIFKDLKTYKNIEFTAISPLIFSEVMRDIDLVVSVAHAGGVDPEASHSSIELRSALLRETLRLFKITNVEIKNTHAIVKGTMGEYSVHLGSAVVHKAAAGYLSILPVHSQHRGRLFLPFMDDDPKTAELISKVLLLARDNEIQDPTILSQLK